ncbi:MAG TPA: hypothetical protein VN026_04660 [Bacteroidia bacterium]|nr:hypothetical protein [Bacteroidia bacterium]
MKTHNSGGSKSTSYRRQKTIKINILRVLSI